MKLSEHFTLEEMCASSTADRLGIDNTPNDEQIKSLTNVCQNILERVRGYYDIPFSPNSGFRSKELNSSVGGSVNSQHTLGEAVDIELPGVSNLSLAWWIRTHLDFDQLILEYFRETDPNSGWVHVSLLPRDSRKSNRNQALVYDGQSYTRGLPG